MSFTGPLPYLCCSRSDANSTSPSDLKPENILLDYNGHIALCDFGLCKLNMSESDRTNTFCGTPEYLAPEILLAKGYGVQVDWWTLGVLLYEMLAGLPPYYDENHVRPIQNISIACIRIDTLRLSLQEIMYKKILQEPLRFPSDMGSDARDILRGLLTRDPAQRLGVNGAEEIKRHPFFAKHVDWRLLLAKKIQPPFKPSVASHSSCLSCVETMLITQSAYRIQPSTARISTRSLLPKHLRIRLWKVPTSPNPYRHFSKALHTRVLRISEKA